MDDNDDPGAADMEPGDKEDVKKKLPVEAPATNSSSAVVTKSSVQSVQAPATDSSAPAVGCSPSTQPDQPQPQKRKRNDTQQESRHYPNPIRPCPSQVIQSNMSACAGQNQMLWAIRHDQQQLRLVVNAIAAEVNSMWHTLQGCQFGLQQVLLELQKMQQ